MVVGRLKTCPIVPFCWQVSAVASLLPPASFYLIEKSSISVQNTALFPVMAHMRTVEAMLFALLEPRITPPEPNIPPRFEEISRKCKKKTQQLFFMKLLFLYSCCASIPFFLITVFSVTTRLPIIQTYMAKMSQMHTHVLLF